MKFKFAFLATLAVVASATADAAVIAWEATKLTGASDVSTNGQLLEALNFSGGINAALRDTSINGVTFAGFVNGSATSNSFPTPTANYYSSDTIRVTPGDVDNYDTMVVGTVSDYDVLLSQRLFAPASSTSLRNTATVSNLQVGQDYEIQLFMGGTNTGENRHIVIDDGLASAFGSETTTNLGDSTVDVSNEPAPNPAGIVITGRFTADANSQSFTITNFEAGALPNAAFWLNGYQLRAVPEPATWCMGLGLAALALSRRVFSRK